MSVTAAGCVGCGGTLLIQDGERLLSCPWCGIPLLIHAPEHVSREVLHNTQTVADVQRSVRAALDRVEIPPQARQAGARARPQLYWVPFHELDARLIVRSKLALNARKVRAGVLRRRPDGSTEYTDRAGNPITQEAYYQGEVIADYDTRVLLHEIHQITPATELAGWGLESLNLRKMRLSGLPAHPYDPVALQAEGMVVSPDRSRDELLESFERSRALLLMDRQSEESELTEQRLQLLYCPVWRLRYSFSGRSYTMTVSGLDGQVMAGSAPENHVRGLAAMLLAGAVVALPVTGIIKALSFMVQGLSAVFHPIPIAAGCLILLVLLNGLVWSWSEFRYRGEVRYLGGKASVVRLKLPAQGGISGFVDACAALQSRIISELREKK